MSSLEVLHGSADLLIVARRDPTVRAHPRIELTLGELADCLCCIGEKRLGRLGCGEISPCSRKQLDSIRLPSSTSSVIRIIPTLPANHKHPQVLYRKRKPSVPGSEDYYTEANPSKSLPSIELAYSFRTARYSPIGKREHYNPLLSRNDSIRQFRMDLEHHHRPVIFAPRLLNYVDSCDAAMRFRMYGAIPPTPLRSFAMEKASRLLPELRVALNLAFSGLCSMRIPTTTE
jgi:hypothetical protein